MTLLFAAVLSLAFVAAVWLTFSVLFVLAVVEFVAVRLAFGVQSLAFVVAASLAFAVGLVLTVV